MNNKGNNRSSGNKLGPNGAKPDGMGIAVIGWG